MKDERLYDLLAYLDRLSRLSDSGMYTCTQEIRECVDSIRSELGLSGKADAINELRDIQGQDGNWDISNYMTGLYNGLELASATLEDREPEYRESDVVMLSE